MTTNSSSGGPVNPRERTVNRSTARACLAAGLAPGSRSPNTSTARSMGTPFQEISSTRSGSVLMGSCPSGDGGDGATMKRERPCSTNSLIRNGRKIPALENGSGST
jgi:hypothetical protein